MLPEPEPIAHCCKCPNPLLNFQQWIAELDGVHKTCRACSTQTGGADSVGGSAKTLTNQIDTLKRVVKWRKDKRT